MLFVYLLLLVASASAKSYPHRWYDLELADLYFEDFKNNHDRHYESAEEHNKRFQIFKQNLIKINEDNMRQQSYTSGITRFSDLTGEEFSRSFTGVRGKHSMPMVEFVNDVENVPDSLDWRDNGMVSPVKDQGNCGSCWAFSTTGMLESAARIHLGSDDILSEQQLVDCDDINFGCDGGWPILALAYLDYEGGIESNDIYPYNGTNGTCKFDRKKANLTVTELVNFNVKNNDDIKAALVKYGPLSLTMDASNLNKYHQGIYECSETDHVNHAVLLVGYGSENGKDYWIVKNSWGTKFGEKGFFRLRRSGDTCLMYLYGLVRANVTRP